jgi:asparagine synthase (glutamine-hydrolysing)
MAGICGIVGAPRPDILASMLALLEHRGPDGEGTYSTDGSILGARRLALVDVAGGFQPALSEDEAVAAILDGEIYNFVELRSLLERRGHAFRSSCDAEVLPHLYEEFGKELTAVINGMFAIAIWDNRRRRLLLARDRAGEKPLLYAYTHGAFVFASTLKAVLAHPEVDRALDPEALALYLQLQYVPGPGTVVASVRKLPPAHRLVFDDRRVRVERYWDIVPSEPGLFRSWAGAAKELHALLESAIRSQIHAEQPVGALLSGDDVSGGIVSLMARVRDEPPETFTVGFEGEALDERLSARTLARKVGARHTERVIGPPSLEDLERLVWHLDEPVADQAAVPMYLISRVVSEHVRVLLTDEGSSQLFAGYPGYGWARFVDRVEILPARLREPIRSAALRVGRSLKADADLLLRPRVVRDSQIAWTGVFGPDELDGVFTSDVARAATARAAEGFRERLAGWRDRPPREQTMYLDLKTSLVDRTLATTDRMSMAWSIEARAPYLDHRIIEFAMSMPPAARLHGRAAMPLLRQAFAPFVLSQAVRRRRNAYALVMQRWLGAQLAEPMRELLLSRDAETRDLIRADVVARTLDEPSREARRRAWTLLILELWLRQFRSRPQLPAAVRM